MFIPACNFLSAPALFRAWTCIVLSVNSKDDWEERACDICVDKASWSFLCCSAKAAAASIRFCSSNLFAASSYRFNEGRLAGAFIVVKRDESLKVKSTFIVALTVAFWST